MSDITIVLPAAEVIEAISEYMEKKASGLLCGREVAYLFMGADSQPGVMRKIPEKYMVILKSIESKNT